MKAGQGSEADGDNLAIWFNHEGDDLTCNVEGRLAVGAECRIQTAIGEVPRQGEELAPVTSTK